MQLFNEIQSESTLPNSFLEISITMKPKPVKDLMKKQRYGQIFQMNIDVKILIRYWQTEYSKSSRLHRTSKDHPMDAGWLKISILTNLIHNINTAKDKNGMIISTHA